MPTPGLADQHRVVLGAALQHLDGAADFLVAADHRVELALAGALGQVERVLGERAALRFGVGAVHALAAAYRVDRGFEALAGQPVVLGQLADVGLAVGHRQQEEFARDELVIALEGLLLGRLQQPGQIGADLHHIVALHLRQALEGTLDGRAEAGHIDAGALEQRARPVVLPQHREQQVCRLDVGVVVRERKPIAHRPALPGTWW